VNNIAKNTGITVLPVEKNYMRSGNLFEKRKESKKTNWRI